MKFVSTIVAWATMVSSPMFMGCSEHQTVKEMHDFADNVCKYEDMSCAQEVCKELGEVIKKYAEFQVRRVTSPRACSGRKSKRSFSPYLLLHHISLNTSDLARS